MNPLRKLRSSLGSRTQRRSGTKTKVLPGVKTTSGGPTPKYRYSWRQKMSPAARMRKALRAACLDARQHEEGGE